MSVVRDFCGHGLGRVFHAPPNVLHYGRPGTGAVLEEGMFFTIEPMVNLGRPETRVLADDWTAITRDKTLSAQFEHSVGVTATGCEIFTASPAGLFHPDLGRRCVTPARWAVLLLALLGCLVSVWRLEQARAGIEIVALDVGTTPATVYRLPDAGPAPVVVIAHGFAGSHQLMEGFALTLARAGYIAVSYDLEGHGRNPVPMSGDVTKIGGTTQILMDELARVADAALALPGCGWPAGSDRPFHGLGHRGAAGGARPARRRDRRRLDVFARRHAERAAQPAGRGGRLGGDARRRGRQAPCASQTRRPSLARPPGTPPPEPAAAPCSPRRSSMSACSTVRRRCARRATGSMPASGARATARFRCAADGSRFCWSRSRHSAGRWRASCAGSGRRNRLRICRRRRFLAALLVPALAAPLVLQPVRHALPAGAGGRLPRAALRPLRRAGPRPRRRARRATDRFAPHADDCAWPCGRRLRHPRLRQRRLTVTWRPSGRWPGAYRWSSPWPWARSRSCSRTRP